IDFNWSLQNAPLAGNAPWGARGLEWELPSPPPTENFVVSPIVTEGTHQYAPSREVGIGHRGQHSRAPDRDSAGPGRPVRPRGAPSMAAAPLRQHDAAGRGVDA